MLTPSQYEQFVSLLPSAISLPLKQAFQQQATLVAYQKGEFVLDENTQKLRIFFVLKGSCIRFILTPEGHERAIMFHTESFIPILGNQYIDSEDSLVYYTIKANEPTELIEFSYSIGAEWYAKDPVFSLYVYQKNVQYLSIVNQFQNHLIGLSSEAFFQWLLKKYPFIFQRFRSKDIASFMGVTAVWLSNIKRRQLGH